MSTPLTAEELARLDQAAEEAGVAAAETDGQGARWLLHPHLGVGWAEGVAGKPVWLGGEIGRATWSLEKGPSLAGRGSFSADFPVGPDTTGRDLRLGALVGPQVGRFSLMLGPVIGEHALHGPGYDLAASWMVAGRVVLAVDAELLSAWVGHTAWSDADDRRLPASGWPGLGDEPEWAGGGGLRLGPLQLRADLSHRDTSEVALWRSTFGVRIQP